FRLRPGVRFHDDPCFRNGEGRAFVADDVVRCFTAICTPGLGDQMFWLFQGRIAGADAYHAAALQGRTPEHLAGVERVDDRTVRITLTEPRTDLLQVLAHPGCAIYPHEMLEHYGQDATWNPVGTGPFRRKHFTPGEVLVLEREPDYWGHDELGNRLPFLDAVRYTFVKDREQEVREFAQGRLSAVFEPPADHPAPPALRHGEARQQGHPGLSLQYYAFNGLRPPFNDPRVRAAFSLAIDRQAIVDSLFPGRAEPALHGIVPPGFAQYPYDSLPPFTPDPAGARDLLRAAGFPGGEGLPTIFLQVSGNGLGYVDVAGQVQGMLQRELGVRVVITVLPMGQHYERVQLGRAAFWREGWVADHPDPANFLEMFHGRHVPADTALPSYLNTTRWQDPAFDAAMDAAMREPDELRRMHLLARADRRLMEQHVVVPLYFERQVSWSQPWVHGLDGNGMDHRDLSHVWFDPAARPR
ncbi:MAG: ABC transporter substrate-binding protein, partial [Flavobacteriales bacterium]|nr:ABC transporter substrate-binding protein [Flavobacteriales bacterium]